MLELTYILYVRPHLDYGDVIYHNQQTQTTELLEKVQYRAGLTITNCWRGTNRSKLYNELGWESLSQRRHGRRLAYYHKIIHDKTPAYLKSHVENFAPRTQRYANSFFPFCADKWPSLPNDLRNAPNTPVFKRLYKSEFVSPKKSFFGLQDWY